MTLPKACPRRYSIAPRHETPAAAAAKILLSKSVWLVPIGFLCAEPTTNLRSSATVSRPHLSERSRLLFSLSKLSLLITSEYPLTLIEPAQP